MKKINIIVPCYNEEDNIKDFIDACAVLNKNYEYLITFVNDGSKDKTAEIVKSYCKEKSYIRLIDFSRNYGKEAAVKAGLDAFNEDAAVVIDADLQMPIRYINDMIEHWEKGEKLVLTVRDKRVKGLKHKLASSFYDVFNMMSKDHLKNDASDFQLMDKDVVEAFNQFTETNRFFKGLTPKVGFDPVVLEIEFGIRHAGESKFGSLPKLFSYAFHAIINHSTSLLKLGLYVGFLFVIASFTYGGYIFVDKLINNHAIEGWTSLMLMITTSTGIIMILLGIIGVYIGKIFEEVKKRPVYFIKEKINF